MVRLKGTSWQGLRFVAKFQFQNGSIKSMRSRFSISALRSFNSKMVRLKVFEETISTGSTMFQFQNGSIKSGFRAKVGKFRKVSIPKWFD